MSTPLYQARDLERCYASGDARVRALVGVDLEIDEGEHLAISGPSGSGKTTLLELLGLLDVDFAGELSFRGKRVREFSARARAQSRLGEIGMVYQGFHLLTALDVRDNVALPHWRLHGAAKQARRRATKLLDELGLSQRLGHRPAQLSAGERQRVAIARALINAPRVLLADEPTGNLDGESTRAVIELFSRICAEGRTLVVVSHDPEVVAAAARVVTLRYGAIVSDDVADEEIPREVEANR